MFDLPFHPVTGLQALGLTGRGPIWPVIGGSQPLGDPATTDPEPQPDPQSEPNPDRGFPENTPIADMTAGQQAAYWKFHDRRKSDRLKAYGDITPEQALQWKQDAEASRREGMQPDQRALEDARTQASEQAAQKATEQWAPVLARQVVGRFVADKAQQDDLLALIDPMKFMKDGEFDTDSLIGKLTGLATAFGANGDQPRQWGQAGDRPPAPSASEQGLAEARRRGYIK